ncbi:hypothetical protein [Buchnera aphidicola]|uniref:Acetylglutamate kinase n=1 Tax=Buchnera aphidicola (Sarucallis kahawaluokalani) TaxID=1241878 RepID=A0A4D6Y7H2_9GAMM|nr:hypothetical protein [Buchnera aphidicola]QCI25846.1 hypothetical protein D9V78_00200 [Buchnera aphidicola (Sarucallis kahawaluokalani)]
MQEILVIKLGGILLNSVVAMKNFFKILCEYKIKNRNILVVHGGTSLEKLFFQNNTIYSKDQLCYNIRDELNINYKKLNLLLGMINTNIVKYARMNGINAIGLNCTDGDTIIFQSADIESCICTDYNSLDLLNYLFSRNIIPIINPTGITKDHTLINIDADIISMFISKALKSRLIMLTDVNAVLDGKGHAIKKMNNVMCEQLILEGVISTGMVTKVNSAIKISKFLNQSVNIASWANFMELKKIFYGYTTGTLIMY